MTDAILPLNDVSTALGSYSMLTPPSLQAGAIDKTAQDFEAMFATQMLQPMFEGVGVDPMFGGGHGEEVMKSFMLQEYGKIIAKSGRLGIANQVKNEMLRAQEAARLKSGTTLNLKQAQNAYANSGTEVANVAH